MKKRVIAIIPARGGSKRIPLKNIKPFLGEPIISYPIHIAQKSGMFDKIMVSTDSPEIERVAKRYGVEVPFFRSAVNSSDRATLSEVIVEVLTAYKERGENFDYCCCILPTAVLLKSHILEEALALLKLYKYTTIIPVTPFLSPSQRALCIKGDKLQMIDPFFEMVRTQDLAITYHDCGMFYWIDIKKFMKVQQIFNDNTGAIILSNAQTQDIDTAEDWKITEMKFLESIKMTPEELQEFTC